MKGPAIPWLLRCCNSGSSSLDLEGRETKQLGSLYREGGTATVIRKLTQSLSLWKQLLLGVKDRYPFKEDVMGHLRRQITMEKGIQYLKELAVLGMTQVKLCAHQSRGEVSTKCTTIIC